jgi:hypothetical protein
MSNAITVKVGQIGQRTEEAMLESGATVRQALNTVGREVPEGYGVEVNSAEATLDTRLSDGDMVVVAKGAKGNS